MGARVATSGSYLRHDENVITNLLIFSYRNIIDYMARARTTSDIFNAIAEPQRRQVLELLMDGELTVNEVAEKLDMRQPQASKHLRVLREVDLVRVRQEGNQRYHQLMADNLKPIFDWAGGFARLWEDRLNSLDDYLQQMQYREEIDGEKADE